ncbi:glycosyltransferase, group 2 family [Leptospira interrogans serovar Bataviae str. HAI135]|nr:glycosyltransferase, group 2 family [Leptospira interrogans serovar Bataviae str. HAI135]
MFGSRFLGGRPHRVVYYWHRLGNMVLTTLSNMFTNINLTDMETCYKAFRREIIQSIDIKENRFGFEPEITAKVSKISDVRIFEVGISYYGRTYAEGKRLVGKTVFVRFIASYVIIFLIKVIVFFFKKSSDSN